MHGNEYIWMYGIIVLIFIVSSSIDGFSIYTILGVLVTVW